ncbi:MAG: hypothetical protein F6K39_01980 [Okeania sp. SIO3B3]|nr:hypothetical protein [Okeania sp. SIO3B3]
MENRQKQDFYFTMFLAVFAPAAYLFIYNFPHPYDSYEYITIGRSLLDSFTLYDMYPSKGPALYYVTALLMRIGLLLDRATISLVVVLQLLALMVAKLERPMFTFGTVGAVLVLLALLLSVPLLVTYMETGLVPRLPTAVLATGMVVVGMLSFVCGFILDTVTRGRQEAKRMRYLSISSPRAVLEEKTGA